MFAIGHVVAATREQARRLLQLGGGVVVGVGALFSSGPNRRR
jgi:hypothetical protein